jgi:hypothetical protein
MLLLLETILANLMIIFNTQACIDRSRSKKPMSDLGGVEVSAGSLQSSLGNEYFHTLGVGTAI